MRFRLFDTVKKGTKTLLDSAPFVSVSAATAISVALFCEMLSENTRVNKVLEKQKQARNAHPASERLTR